jgi:ribosomal protein L4
MKNTAAINQKYRALRHMAILAHEATLADLVRKRKAEIEALPDAEKAPRNREDRMPRFCVTCGGQFALATKESAKLLARVVRLRFGGTDEETDWQAKLAGLRTRRRKYCCYACQTGRSDLHNAPCCLQSEMDIDAGEMAKEATGKLVGLSRWS